MSSPATDKIPPHKTITVNRQDWPVWQHATHVAAELGISLTRLIVRSLLHYPGTVDTITVPVSEPGQQQRHVAFAGRWLVDPDLHSDRTFPCPATNPRYSRNIGVPDGWRFGVAITKQGRIVVHRHHWTHDPSTAVRLDYYESLAVAERALADDPLVPASLWTDVRRALAPAPDPTWLDI
jgi:hypothetical protein